MKRFLLFLFCFPLFLGAQSLGFSAGIHGFIPIYKSTYLQDHRLESKGGIIPALRLEANLAANSFSGFGVSFSGPVHDSVFIMGDQNYNRKTWVGTSITHYFNFSVKFSLEIPQDISQFLLVHAGLGIGWDRQKIKYNLADYDPVAVRFYNTDINTGTLIELQKETAPELFVGALYEFEKFSVFGQYIFRYMLGDAAMNYRFNNVLSAGIYYPIKRF